MESPLKCVVTSVAVCVILLYSLPGCFASVSYVCNDQNQISFHADKSMACKAYFMCFYRKMSRLPCHTGYAFDDSKLRCVEAATFACNEKNLVRNKRSDIRVHSISKTKATETAWHLLESIKTDIMDAVKEAAPSIYDSLENNYIPILKSIKDDIMPIVKQNVLPRVQKAYVYGRNIGGLVYKKLHQSWEMSNATHINIVSFSDVASRVSNDLKPVLHLGRYLSSRMATRSKRSIVPSRSFFDTVSAFVQPFAHAIFKGVTSMAAANDPFLRDYVLPMVYEMMDDPTTAAEIKEIVWIAKRIYSPIASEMFRNRRYVDSNGFVIQVSNPVLNHAKYRLYTEVKPIVTNILERHLQMILYRTGENLPLITDTLERIEQYSGHEVKNMKHDLLLFFAKHSEFLWTNDESFRNVQTFTEMKEDLMPIKKNLLKVAMDYLSHSPNSWLNFLFSRNSYLYQLL